MNYHKHTQNEVRSYLAHFYSPTFRKGDEDHYYNFRSRQTIGLPISKSLFTDEELIEIMKNKTELSEGQELIRFKQFKNT